MKKSTLGIFAVGVILVGGGGGCILKKSSQTSPASQQERAAAPSVTSESASSPTPTTPNPSAREASSPSVSEIVVTKTMDSAGSVTPPAPTPTSAGTSTGTAPEKMTAPTAVSPATNTKFMPADALKSMTFKWTPLVPKPTDPVTYRMKVWQLMQGQSGSQAMKTNQPIVTKDVDNITQATVSGIYTGPCRPPYLCDFVWVVEAISGGVRIGASDVSTFSVAAETTSSQSSADGTAGVR